MKAVTNRKCTSALAAAAAAGLLLSNRGAHAETYVPTSGTSSWSTAANWVENTFPNAPGATAIFPTPTAARSVTLGADITVGAISIANDTNTQSDIGSGSAATTDDLIFDAGAAGAGGGPATVTVTGTGGGQNRITAPMILTDSLTINVQNLNGGTGATPVGAFSLLGSVSGAGGVTKTGPGRMTWAFTPSTSDRFKTYTGPTEINDGRVRMSVGARPTGTSSFTITGTGQLTPTQTGTYSFGDGTVPLSITGNGPTSGPDMNFKGAIVPDANLDVTFSNPVTLPGGTAVVASRRAPASATGSLTFTNVISGPGAIQFNASAGDNQIGTYFVKNTGNTYTGGTIVYGGTLDATQGNLGAPTSPLTVNVIEFGGASTTVLLNTSSPTTVGTLSGFRFGNSSTINNGGQLFTVHQQAAGTYDGVITGAGGFRLGSGSTAALTLTGSSNYTGGTTVEAGTLRVNRLHENNAVSVTGGKLQVMDSSPTLPSHPSGNHAFVSRPSSLAIANNGEAIGSRTYSGQLDLGNNDLILDYDGASPLAEIEDMVRAGYNGGDWLGNGIASSTANANRNFAIGVADNSRLTIPFSATRQFSGQTVDTTTILVKFTHRIDLDLDGVITTNDATIFNSNYTEGAPAYWSIGDLDYDRVFTTNDATLFNSFYSEALASVPEPAALGVLGLAGLGLLRRRDRNTY